MMMRKFWPLLMAGSVGAMSVQAAPADTYELLVGSYTAGTSEGICLLYTSPSPRDRQKSRMPSSA